MVRQNYRLGIDSETIEYYSRLRQEFSSIKLYNSQLFSLALTIGYCHGVRKPLNKRMEYIRHETIPSDLFSIIILLGIDVYGVDGEWVNNPLVLFDLAEEYANAGIEILMEKCKDFSLEEYLTSVILELYNSTDFNSIYDEFISD